MIPSELGRLTGAMEKEAIVGKLLMGGARAAGRGLVSGAKGLGKKLLGPGAKKQMLASRKALRSGGGQYGLAKPPWTNKKVTDFIGGRSPLVSNPRFQRAVDTAFGRRVKQLARDHRPIHDNTFRGVQRDVMAGRGHSPIAGPVSEFVPRRAALGYIGRDAARQQALRALGITGVGGAGVGYGLSR